MSKKSRDPVLFRKKEKPDPFNRAALDFFKPLSEILEELDKSEKEKTEKGETK